MNWHFKTIVAVADWKDTGLLMRWKLDQTPLGPNGDTRYII